MLNVQCHVSPLFCKTCVILNRCIRFYALNSSRRKLWFMMLCNFFVGVYKRFRIICSSYIYTYLFGRRRRNLVQRFAQNFFQRCPRRNFTFLIFFCCLRFSVLYLLLFIPDIPCWYIYLFISPLGKRDVFKKQRAGGLRGILTKRRC